MGVAVWRHFHEKDSWILADVNKNPIKSCYVFGIFSISELSNKTTNMLKHSYVIRVFVYYQIILGISIQQCNKSSNIYQGISS